MGPLLEINGPSLVEFWLRLCQVTRALLFWPLRTQSSEPIYGQSFLGTFLSP